MTCKELGHHISVQDCHTVHYFQTLHTAVAVTSVTKGGGIPLNGSIRHTPID